LLGRKALLRASEISIARKDKLVAKGKMHDHCGPMNSRSEMMKAWDAPKGAEDNVKEAGRVSDRGGMQKEAGASDPKELK
jgi:hypothetical protein